MAIAGNRHKLRRLEFALLTPTYDLAQLSTTPSFPRMRGSMLLYGERKKWIDQLSLLKSTSASAGMKAWGRNIVENYKKLNKKQAVRPTPNNAAYVEQAPARYWPAYRSS